ncbi:hypothetical protein [Fuerstiella marisgermanici]|uniref:Uncharacterized protein n=1 Tax=Fuerstiella marisgermanici TaxID=1891926 RepID=A0A1P8WMY7_9PLAN|nr:hypothetical protein [Fuerstiella marisgermanici]APZ95433.1 hypothetical protein Fuma_05091 [Fuerstiella marisgermanici]
MGISQTKVSRSTVRTGVGTKTKEICLGATLIRFRATVCVALAVFSIQSPSVADDATSLTIDRDVATTIDYDVQITGEIVTPSADGARRFPLKSSGEFQFRNEPFPTDLGGPFSLRAVRKFESAATTTTVGADHVTKVALLSAYRSIHVFGDETGLLKVSPKYSLPRKQLDLLEIPFDPIAVGAMLPGSSVSKDDKWNTDVWVVPMLTGIEAVVEQSTTCRLETVSSKKAVVTFEGKISGAVRGSASEISFDGQFVIDREAGLIESFTAQQKEKRSPGPVSPGLDVTVDIKWTQQATDRSPAADTPPIRESPSDSQKLLVLQTPLRLQFRHSREWHLFHETPTVLMMRQLRDGNLISQCNISSAVAVPPKEHTPDKEFLADVTESVAERRGKVTKEETVRDDAEWRIRRIQGVGNADGETIIWDYYLCSEASGQQFSLVFSHAEKDEAEFADSATKILSTLQIARPKPALPFR